MSTKKNDRFLKFITDAGAAVWPKLNKARRFDKKLNKSVDDPVNGKFEIDLALEGTAADALKAKITAFAEKQGLDVEEVKNWPWAAEKVKDDNGKVTKTGRTLFKFKAHATNLDGTPKRIAHWDAQAKPLSSSFVLTGGSTVKVSGFAKAFKELGGGVSLSVDAVQVLKYVEQEVRNPGFGVEEGYAGADDADEDGSSPFETQDDGEAPSNSTDF
ncbi:hypothetical protein M2323_004701 [Rhodoblastus acidophilus]|uniref:hypothetical protein n=1 Tax=Rhodoblastus acidophilus TaxID=1074 RepID=UPI0022245143|nr:hypothetical protein [Rhodoblastus acidophilus]MCW2286657.1 hypothetical protein [Rhodoblastus acidophilus]MCW2335745.1 hypothetical protein [Rhodoblastus acidophilus]